MTQQATMATPQQVMPESSAQKNYYHDWLAKHQSVLSGIETAVVYLKIGANYLPVASIDAENSSYPELAELAEQQLQSTQPQVTRLSSDSTQNEVFGLLYPVLDKQSEFIAFVAFAVRVSSKEQLTQALTLIQWSVSGIETVEFEQRLQRSLEEQQHYATRVEILARVLSEVSFDEASVRLVTELAVLFDCDRVSLGEYKNKRSRLKHLSHSAQFGKKMNHVRLIERVMDECLDQGRVIRIPNLKSDENLITQAHQEMSSQHGDIGIMSVPLYLRGETFGALVVEGKPEQVWSEPESELCQSIASIVLPTLVDKQRNDRPWYKKLIDASANQLKRLFGPNYLGRKLIFLALLGIGYLLATVTSQYKLSADAQIESAVQQAIVAPYDGYISDALVRAGDRVTVDDPLVLMDDRDLRLEKLKWLSEQSKINRQRLEALSARDRAKINILNAEQKQVEAQLELVDSQIERGQLLAPYDGLVVSGDLSQRLGSAVTKGDLLLEVAPAESYRIKLMVQESRISDLELGQLGTLYLSALPESGFDFTVSKITPITEVKDGASYFIVEGELSELSSQFQPGMEGIGKVAIDERLLFDIWTRDLTEWLRLRIWSWWG
ncbi:HlyD family efflux transporter periplasmic adaptor subunit [Vibrio comitans]|uniref:GAF domain-containing protein n=1 Tax=Vibrio comitans NBRC 102076 TaxID=1219078 RepID=A0A4Y3IM88_9VIBR|nr:HlyD family efflux transporter periplasmic adaptor subunit [Vibrio comitans]GEA60611.1 hypothetical protein VCO01S_18040 [Vibrio comitans NBRC 102076]